MSKLNWHCNLLFIIMLYLPNISIAKEDKEPETDPKVSQEEQEPKEHIEDTKNMWEVSFGTTQLFNSWYSSRSIPVPTASATLIVTRKVSEEIALWGVFNLPLTPNQNTDKADETDETDEQPRRMSIPTFMLGVSYEIFKYTFGKDKDFGVDTGFSIGRELISDGRFFPLGATRVKVVKEDDTTVYVGITSAPYNKNFDLIWGLIYGVGTRF